MKDLWIRIPDNEEFNGYSTKSKNDDVIYHSAKDNVVILPEGHGRLIDEDCVILSICQQHCAEIFHSCRYNCRDISHIVKAQTVIEADENREIKFKYN